MMASFSEGLTLGKKIGLDPATIVQVVGQGAIAAPMFALKGPSMIKGSYPPAFALKHQQKVRNCDQLCFCVKPETLTRRS
jgi:glyoxylate/succinic semialdehyde reductase